MSWSSGTWIIAVLLLLGIASCLFHVAAISLAVNPERQCNHFRSASFLAQARGELPEAERDLQQSLKLADASPNDLQEPAVLCDLAQFYEAQHRYAEAESFARQAVAEADRRLARTDVIAYFEKWRALRRRALTSRLILASILKKQNRFEQELKIYDEIFKTKHGKDHLMERELVLSSYLACLRNCKRFEEARDIETHELVNTASTADAARLYATALKLFSEKKTEQAEHILGEVQSIAFNHKNNLQYFYASIWIVICKMCKKDLASAELVLEKLPPSEDRNLRCQQLVFLSFVKDQLGKRQDSKELSQKAEELGHSPTDYGLLNWLRMSYASDKAKAAERQLDPDVVLSLYNLDSWVLNRELNRKSHNPQAVQQSAFACASWARMLGRYLQSAEYFELGFKQNARTKPGTEQFEYAITLDALARQAQADMVWQKIPAKECLNTNYHRTVARFYVHHLLQSGKIQQAISLEEKIVQDSKKRGAAEISDLYFLGMCHKKLGQIKQARQAWLQAIAIGPGKWPKVYAQITRELHELEAD